MTVKSSYYTSIACGIALSTFGLPAMAGEVAPPVNTNFAELIGKSLFGEQPLSLAEFKVMDPACKLVLLNYSEENRFWLNTSSPHPILQKPEFRMARTASWFHHYCDGKIHRFRYFISVDKLASKNAMVHWITNMEYSVHGISVDLANGRNYQYKYIIYHDMAEAAMFAKKYDTAIKYSKMAIADNKRYTKAYVVAAKTYIQAGVPAEAMEMVKAGLAIEPEAKPLIRLRAELGSQPSSNPAPLTAPHAPADGHPLAKPAAPLALPQ